MEFTWKGVRIQFHFLFFWTLAFLVLLDRSGFVAMSLLAAIIHELGHIVAFILLHDLPSEISFEAAGIRMVRSEKDVSVKKELFQLFMGSITNFVVFLLFSFSLKTVNQASVFAVSHLLLGIFNLLPIQALDGGKVLYLLLSQILYPETAYRISRGITWTTILLLTIFSIYLCRHGKGNLSLLLICGWLTITSMK